MFSLKRVLILCVAFSAGCDYPPEKATIIQEQLQAKISKGQVYVTHSSEELSYMIKNSEFNTRSEADQDSLIKSVETVALEVLSENKNYKIIRIYFVGDGAAGINRPYLCQASSNACLKTSKQGES